VAVLRQHVADENTPSYFYLFTQGGRGTQEFFHSPLENADAKSDHSSTSALWPGILRTLSMSAHRYPVQHLIHTRQIPISYRSIRSVA